MDKFIDPRILPDNSEDTEKRDYVLPLTEEQKADAKDKLAEVSIRISRLEKEKKDFNDQIKTQMNPMVKEKNEVLKEINSGVREYYGITYEIHDDQEMMIGVYANTGDLIETKPLVKKGRQMSILSNTGTE